MERAPQFQRSIRRLTSLEETASTARVFNLLAIRRRFKDHPEMIRAPVFQNRLLNQSIILKHRLRADEYSHFHAPRAIATKLLIPIDPADLRLGARYVFVGQRDFDDVAKVLCGAALQAGSPDLSVLKVMDELPSLDPFLLREKLRQSGFEPARPYFAVSDADVRKMFAFVREQVMSLVELSGDEGGLSTDRFVRKLLSTTPESSFSPLKDVLGLSDREYEDGIFSWRGFLYYKWSMADALKPAAEVAREIIAIRPQGFRSPEAAAYLREAKPRIIGALSEVTAGVRTNLAIYDQAYAALTSGRPAAFRDFLLAAPDLFGALGVSLGAVRHIVSYWRYRFPPGAPHNVSAPDLMDLFLDFEAGLAIGKSAPRLRAPGSGAPALLEAHKAA